MAYKPTCPKCQRWGAVYRVYRRYRSDEGKRGYKDIGYQCATGTRTSQYKYYGHGCGHVWMDGDPTKGGLIEVEKPARPDPRSDFTRQVAEAHADHPMVDDPSPPPDEDDDWSATPQAAIQGDAGQAEQNGDQEPPAMVNLGQQEDL